MIEVRWSEHRVALIDSETGFLVESTLAFAGIWIDFQKNGVTVMDAAPDTEAKGNVRRDGTLVLRNMENFKAALIGMGYTVKEV